MNQQRIIVRQKNRNNVITRCENPDCRKPIVVASNRYVHFVGQHGLGHDQDGNLVVSGKCPICSMNYEIVNPEKHIPTK